MCQYYGIQTGDNSFGYIASWSQGKELKELRASLETINKTSCELISDIDRHYKEICKERGIDLTAKEEMEPQKESASIPAGEDRSLSVQIPVRELIEAMPEMEVIEPNVQQMQGQVSQQAEENAALLSQLPGYQEQALDEYPMPDPALMQDDLEKCGYLFLVK